MCLSFWSGTEKNYALRPLFADAASAAAEKRAIKFSKALESKPAVISPQVQQATQLFVHPKRATLSPQNDLLMTFQINPVGQNRPGHLKVRFDATQLRFKSALSQNKEQPGNFLATSRPGSGLIEVEWKGLASEENSNASFTVVFGALQQGKSFIEFMQVLPEGDPSSHGIKSLPAEIIIQ